MYTVPRLKCHFRKYYARLEYALALARTQCSFARSRKTNFFSFDILIKCAGFKNGKPYSRGTDQ